MFSRAPLLCLSLVFVSAHVSWGQAVVEGTVALPKAAAAPVMNKRYQVVTKGGVIATNPAVGVVYLEGSFPRPAVPLRQEMAQKDLAFVMPLLAVQTGTTIEFPNLDETYHNIFSYSQPKRFDLGRYRSEERPIPSQLFDQPGLVVLHCDIHEHMRGLILVLDTPHFVKTDTEGRYRLAGLPAGNYTLKAWVNSSTTYSRPIQLKSGGKLLVDFP